MNPFDSLDAFVAYAKESVAEALIKTVFIVGCAGLTVACVIVMVARRTGD